MHEPLRLASDGHLALFAAQWGPADSLLSSELLDLRTHQSPADLEVLLGHISPVPRPRA